MVGDGGLEAEPPAGSRPGAEWSGGRNVGGTCPPVPPIIAAPARNTVLGGVPILHGDGREFDAAIAKLLWPLL